MVNIVYAFIYLIVRWLNPLKTFKNYGYAMGELDTKTWNDILHTKFHRPYSRLALNYPDTLAKSESPSFFLSLHYAKCGNWYVEYHCFSLSAAVRASGKSHSRENECKRNGERHRGPEAKRHKWQEKRVFATWNNTANRETCSLSRSRLERRLNLELLRRMLCVNIFFLFFFQSSLSSTLGIF